MQVRTSLCIASILPPLLIAPPSASTPRMGSCGVGAHAIDKCDTLDLWSRQRTEGACTARPCGGKRRHAATDKTPVTLIGQGFRCFHSVSPWLAFAAALPPI